MFRAVGVCGVITGNLALLDGDVDDFVLAVDVADGVDIRLIGAHGTVDHDPAVVGLDAGFVQVQPFGIGTAA